MEPQTSTALLFEPSSVRRSSSCGVRGPRWPWVCGELEKCFAPVSCVAYTGRAKLKKRIFSQQLSWPSSSRKMWISCIHFVSRMLLRFSRRWEIVPSHTLHFESFFLLFSFLSDVVRVE